MRTRGPSGHRDPADAVLDKQKTVVVYNLRAAKDFKQDFLADTIPTFTFNQLMEFGTVEQFAVILHNRHDAIQNSTLLKAFVPDDEPNVAWGVVSAASVRARLKAVKKTKKVGSVDRTTNVMCSRLAQTFAEGVFAVIGHDDTQFGEGSTELRDLHELFQAAYRILIGVTTEDGYTETREKISKAAATGDERFATAWSKMMTTELNKRLVPATPAADELDSIKALRIARAKKQKEEDDTRQ
jgi:hypothetical protein